MPCGTAIRILQFRRVNRSISCIVMYRIVSTILIAALLFSQSVFLIPHTHAADISGVPDDHAARPHIHLPGSHHHHGQQHSHAQDESHPGVPASDHDTDALYAGEVHLLKDGQSPDLTQMAHTCLVATLPQTVAADIAVAPAQHVRNGSLCPPFALSLCALFLQTQSIRC